MISYPLSADRLGCQAGQPVYCRIYIDFQFYVILVFFKIIFGYQLSTSAAGSAISRSLSSMTSYSRTHTLINFLDQSPMRRTEQNITHERGAVAVRNKADLMGTRGTRGSCMVWYNTISYIGTVSQSQWSYFMEPSLTRLHELSQLLPATSLGLRYR